MVMDYAFLISGKKWTPDEIKNLGFDFSLTTPAYHYAPFSAFYEYFNATGQSQQFSTSADPLNYDQQDLVRFLLLSPDELTAFSDHLTINTRLIEITNTSTMNGFVNYRVSFADVIDAHFSEASSGYDDLTIAEKGEIGKYCMAPANYNDERGSAPRQAA